MKAKEIEVGKLYRAKVSGILRTVRVDAIRMVRRYDARNSYSGQSVYKDKTIYEVTNLATKRQTIFRSAAKFRYVASEPEQVKENQ